MTNKRYTATVRRFSGISGKLQMARRIVTPVDLFLESFAECWPFHRKTIQEDGTYRVMVYSTQGRFLGWNADYYFTVTPINA